MFEKLLALIPYNPGLLGQMSFYSRRMREEASIRRIGMIFLTLAFVLQFLAVLNPPQSTFANSCTDNNILHCGYTDQQDAVNKCNQNVQDFAGILKHYGISCAAVAAGTMTTVHSSSSLPYYSVGRLPQGCNDKRVSIDGVSYYWRRFNCVALQDAFTAIHVHSSDGTTFYILKDCGNLVSNGPPLTTATITGTSSNVPAPTPTTPTVTPTPTPPPVTPPQPCQFSPSLPAGDVNCKPCDKSVNQTDTIACVVISKSALNVTAGGSDANNTTANPGDVITYTLNVQNTGKATVSQYVFTENIADVLDYSTVTDPHGGTLDSFNNISWPNVDIAPGQTVSHQITVKVKDPIPNTPADPNNPGRFDLTMTNTYGNTINIKVPGSPTKQVEVAAAALPNTGPGTSLFIAASIVIVAGYFWGRAGLLAKESAMAVKETSAL
jgi:uncharacterized repeat protein (TIGR01451 family)